ncbi:MAG TPA: FAD-binding protein [Sphingomonadales bacterium]|nr:FAD-binding protein [Sphingomonadales bacterium]
MAILVLAEHDNKALKESTLHAVSAALKLGGDPHVLVAGKECQAVADAAARVKGAAKVLHCDDGGLEHPLAEALAELVVLLAADYDYLLAPATTFGKNVMPRVAALLDVMQVSDVIAIEGGDTFKRPIYAGNAIQTVQSTDGKNVLTLRTTAYPAAPLEGGNAEVAPVKAPPAKGLSAFVKAELSRSARPELTSAKIIVSGGRGVGSAENFKLIERLADKLGAAIGASRAAVDAGFVPNDFQVGQTGKIVAPELYIAIGISGAIQHLAGMKDSKIIVAINKDEEAPIFQVADYGLVGDLFEILPELEKAL